MKLRIVSYNVQRGIGLDLRSDLDRARTILERIDADVVAIQEVTRVDGAERDDQAGFLARALGMRAVRCEVRPAGKGTYGHALLTRLPVLGSEDHDLTIPGHERRRCLRVDVEVGDGALHLFSCHLGLGIRERRAQLERLVAFLRQSPAQVGRRVLMGDMNEWYRGPLALTLRRELGCGTSMRERTHPALLPVFALDRIYWDRALEGEVSVYQSPPARRASDHLPVVAELRDHA
jgi:endonuclease/exonuclease/phosphatase family metal-dependent hydrolase